MKQAESGPLFGHHWRYFEIPAEEDTMMKRINTSIRRDDTNEIIKEPMYCAVPLCDVNTIQTIKDLSRQKQITKLAGDCILQISKEIPRKPLYVHVLTRGPNELGVMVSEFEYTSIVWLNIPNSGPARPVMS